jgi:FkbM family methyltransferase
MTNSPASLKRLATRWVRPPLVPFVRWTIRYASRGTLRQALWDRLVLPYFRFSHTDFVARTVSGTSISGNTRDFIQRHVFYFGVWEPNLTAFLERRLRAGDVFVDVGANIGYFTLLASRCVGPTGRVLALEASPQTYRHLLRNLTGNGTANVEAINVAASDRRGTASMFRAEASNIGASSLVATAGREFEADVATDSLDALLQHHALTNVRFVKIDVEGAEWLVLQGMRDLLAHAAQDLEVCVELRPQSLSQYGRSVTDVLSLFAGFGFHPYRIDNDYSTAGYMSPRAATPPVRLRTAIVSQTDVIFSRVDADTL